MTITDLITQLEKVKAKEGDLPVKWDSISHRFDPDLAVRGRGDQKVLVLNA